MCTHNYYTYCLLTSSLTLHGSGSLADPPIDGYFHRSLIHLGSLVISPRFAYHLPPPDADCGDPSSSTHLGAGVPAICASLGSEASKPTPEPHTWEELPHTWEELSLHPFASSSGGFA